MARSIRCAALPRIELVRAVLLLNQDDARLVLCAPTTRITHGRGLKLERQRDFTDERPLNVLNVLHDSGPCFASV